MGDATSSPDNKMETILDASGDLDLMDELFLSGDWLEIADPGFLHQDSSASAAPFDLHSFSPLTESVRSSSNPEQLENDDRDGPGRPSFSSSSTRQKAMTDDCKFGISAPSGSWAIEQRASTDTVSIRERLNQVLKCIQESHREGNILVQIWAPVKKGDKQVLTTCGQPYWFDPNCQKLMDYRKISKGYHFSADESSSEVHGLPGRVFLGKVPEWTPDVRFFSSFEYPRVIYAQHYDVRGSLALPIFERGSRSCLGVLEVVMTTEKINYSSDLENICNALQAVDLMSSDVSRAPSVKTKNDSYQSVLPEISEVLRAVCEMHELPLAQTWISCAQQGKRGSRHSEENYENCISTVDVACCVKNPRVLGFHEACSEHHLFKGQGVAGEAFTTNQPCFLPDITALSKTEYPLSHHARLFNLRGAVAIRLRSVYSGTVDFVLEFFLPSNCADSEEQKIMLNSLSTTIQQVCWSLRVISEKELGGENTVHGGNMLSLDKPPWNQRCEERQFPNRVKMHDQITGLATDPRVDVPLFTGLGDTQEKGKNQMHPSMELEFEDSTRGFSFTTTDYDSPEIVLPAGKIFQEQNRQDFNRKTSKFEVTFTDESENLKSQKAKEKKRAKMEKSVSLQILQQYFTGSLKDAAKSIGVCPTTLKRICRQHGITRWPSRKIKKVGHSLRKLKVVIDSVQGVEGAFQFSSLYANFPEVPQLNSIAPNVANHSQLPTLKQTDKLEPFDAQRDLKSMHAAFSNSPSSSCSHSSNSSQSCSTDMKKYTCIAEVAVKTEPPVEENHVGVLRRAHSAFELQPLFQGPLSPLASSQDHKSNHSLESLSHLHENMHAKESIRVKAICGDDKVRFKLQPSWRLRDLKEEILKRFSIRSTTVVDLKYLDDDSEWVLLTCDADLQECIDVYKSSSISTIKISVHIIEPHSSSFGLSTKT